MARPNLKNTTAIRAKISQNKKIKDKELFDKTKFLEAAYTEIPYRQRSWHFKRNLFEPQFCNCGNLMIFVIKRYKYCSRKCTDLIVRKKSEMTNVLKYGVKNVFQSDKIKQKIKDTCVLKYGVQNAGALDHFNYKDYFLPSGRKIRVQGFENKALDILLTKFTEDDILYGPKEIHNIIGHIEYKLDGKIKRYYPDFYIQSINTIIEVKSCWTYDKKGHDKKLRHKNQLKRKACLKRGLSFEFMIM